jgi:large subunit ribosomal protein L22
MNLTSRYIAKHRFARISVRKLHPILDLIRGRYADDAVDTLKYLPHRGARMIEKVLKSAMANAEDKGIRNVGDLLIVDARGDGGPMFKRLMPRARGMAYMIRRRSAHIQIGLNDLESLRKEEEEAKTKTKTEARAKAKAGTKE